MAKSIQTGMRNIQKKAKSTVWQMEQTEKKASEQKKHWLDWIDCSDQGTYVHTLAKRIKQYGSSREFEEIVYKKQPALITDPTFATNPNACTINLPKVKDSLTSPLNFSFGNTVKEQKENYIKMVEASKTFILSYTHEYTEDDNTYNLLQFYLVAPELEKTDLPVIYKIDVLANPKKTYFYGLRASALVGGCVDGYCTLFQMGKLGENTARMFTIQSGHTNKLIDYEDDVTNAYYKIAEIDNICNVFEAANFMFNHFNVKNRINTPNETKIFEIIHKLNKGTINTVALTGEEIIKAYFERGIEHNEKKIRQTVYGKDEIEENLDFSFRR